jgi:hypothetical protein
MVGGGVLVLLLAAVAARQFLTGLAFGAALRRAGATEVRFHVAEVSLWRVALEDVGFLLKWQQFAAGRVALDRAHWWMPSLGTLRVEDVRVPVKLQGSDPRPPPVSGGKAGGAVRLPFEQISIEGQVVVQAAGFPDQALLLKIEAHPTAQGPWQGNAQLSAPGLGLKGEGRYDLGNGELAFKVPDATLDLKLWQGFVRQLLSVPAGDWEVEGKLSGHAEGRLTGNKLVATGGVRLSEGHAAMTAKAVVAEGIEADLEFSDLAVLIAKPGTLRIRELRAGQLTLRELGADFSLAGADHVTVSRASLQALGGSMSAEPFVYVPSRSELDAVLRVDGISIEEVLALTKDLPAKATGRVNGRVPVLIGSEGLRFGTGWLELKPGVQAEIQFGATGLLTSGTSPNSPSYAVLQKVESGLLRLAISELRLDIRPANAPDGRSAQLHLKGAPVDPQVKAPVILDLNVNGPLEKLINMGLDSRLSIGAGK